MRKLFILIFLCLACFSFGQGRHVKVTLKNGVVITGQVKEFIATDHLTILLAGTESVISINDIFSIDDEIVDGSVSKDVRTTPESDKLVSGQYTITDNTICPDSIVIDVEGEKIIMIYVPGGDFTMGYDGRHSLSMESEPLHNVTLSSFYISKECITKEIASILNDESYDKKKSKYITGDWDFANDLIIRLREKTGIEFRFLTEAEWEYTAIIPKYEYIFVKEKTFEWCYDFYDEYPSTSQVNPRGPIKGKKHVVRSFYSGQNKWQRSFKKGKYSNNDIWMKYTDTYYDKEDDDDYKVQLRIAIDADKLIN